MDAETLLTTRASNPKLQAPAPDAVTLDLAFEAAARAPDHGLLHPYRFLVVRDEGRQALGDLLAAGMRATQPAATDVELDRQRQKALRAPLIIVVVASPTAHPKVPAVEQLLCAGAAAQNILLALHARGFTGIWRTGPAAYSEVVKGGLGLAPEDAIVGFIYAGTAAQPAPARSRPDSSRFVHAWPAGAGPNA